MKPSIAWEYLAHAVNILRELEDDDAFHGLEQARISEAIMILEFLVGEDK